MAPWRLLLGCRTLYGSLLMRPCLYCKLFRRSNAGRVEKRLRKIFITRRKNSHASFDSSVYLFGKVCPIANFFRNPSQLIKSNATTNRIFEDLHRFPFIKIDASVLKNSPYVVKLQEAGVPCSHALSGWVGLRKLGQTNFFVYRNIPKIIDNQLLNEEKTGTSSIAFTMALGHRFYRTKLTPRCREFQF